MQVQWSDLTDGRADAFDGAPAEMLGWLVPLEPASTHSYFLLAPEPVCCFSCRPTDPSSSVEIFIDPPIAAPSRAVRLTGRWVHLHNDPTGWRYQMRDARLVPEPDIKPAPHLVSRREMVAAGAALTLAAGARFSPAHAQETDPAAAHQMIAGTLTLDMHSHAGRVLRIRERVTELADPMRDGAMAVVCLASVADYPVTRVQSDGRVVAVREPQLGELYYAIQVGLRRILTLAKDQNIRLVTNNASLLDSAKAGPSIIVSSEGADFLEGQIERLDEAYETFHLRHLQLTHYRVNELGDIQTVPPVHGGLTDFGAEVIRACNRRGIVVDVAHGTFDLVKRAVSVTSKPLILSHTSLSENPRRLSRQISSDHAKAIAATGGVIGVWPNKAIFGDLAAMARGMADMVDVVGIDHVGLGSDMLGLTLGSVFEDYRDLPRLAAALLAQGFKPDETAKLLGGNYARVFAEVVG